MPWLTEVQRPTRPRRIPSVLTKAEVAALLGAMDGEMALLAKLLYGTGMRLMEGLRLRVKDVDFDRQVLVVREAKGGKDRVVWTHDREVGAEGVEVPDALAVKYPDMGRLWGWFLVFPAAKLSIDPRSRIERRHRQPAGCVAGIGSASICFITRIPKTQFAIDLIAIYEGLTSARGQFGMNETSIPIHAIKGHGTATRIASRVTSAMRFDDGWGTLPVATEVTFEDAKSAITRNDIVRYSLRHAHAGPWGVGGADSAML
ncbi:MAG: tyrosine-type recombinase/integrase [Rhodoferax sp.]|nr:tyrosine-type recombinase/integrase [Rhodoferax sp.]